MLDIIATISHARTTFLQQSSNADLDLMISLYEKSLAKHQGASSNSRTPLLKSLLLARHHNNLQKLLSEHEIDHAAQKVALNNYLVDEYNSWIETGSLSKPMAKYLYAAITDALKKEIIIDAKSIYPSLIKPILDAIKNGADTAHQESVASTARLANSKLSRKKLKELESGAAEASKKAKVWSVEKWITIQDVISLSTNLTAKYTTELLEHSAITQTESLGVQALHAVIISSIEHMTASKLQALINLLPEGGMAKMMDQISDAQTTELLNNLHKNKLILPINKQKIVLDPLLELISPEELEILSPVWAKQNNGKHSNSDESEELELKSILHKAKSSKIDSLELTEEGRDSGYATPQNTSDNTLNGEAAVNFEGGIEG